MIGDALLKLAGMRKMVFFNRCQNAWENVYNGSYQRQDGYQALSLKSSSVINPHA